MTRRIASVTLALLVGAGATGAAQSLPRKYRTWLEREAAYLITPDERAAFVRLGSDEARERFIAAFWERRDPTFGTQANEFKDEHYRRIDDANRLFGVAGWRSDRGRLYISWGPPDLVETNPAGSRGFVLGQLSEAPELASEVWTYHHLPARRFGSGPVQVVFVDRGAGDYELLGDADNANLAYVYRLNTAANPLQYESAAFFDPVTGLRTSDRSPELARSQALGPDRSLSAAANPFERIELTADLQRTPAEVLADIERSQGARGLEPDIRTALYTKRFPIAMQVVVLEAPGGHAYCPLAVSIPGDAIGFERTDRYRATLAVRGEIREVTGRRLVQRFVETLEFRLTPDTYERGRASGFSYHKPLRLTPGTYSVDVVVKDVAGAAVGLASATVTVPGAAEGLRVLGLVLAESAAPAGAGEATPFTLGGLEVRPRVGSGFGRDETLHAVFQLAGYAGDGGAASLTVDYTVLQGEQLVLRTDVMDVPTGGGPTVLVAQPIALASFAPGDYVLQVKAIDRRAGRHALARAAFSVR